MNRIHNIKLAAGSLAAAGLLALLAPLNMGGCGDAGQMISSAVSSVGSSASGAGGSISGGVGALTGRGGGGVDYVGAFQGGTQIIHGLTLTEEDERAMGECVALAGANKYRIVADDALNRYLTLVAQSIADATPTGGKPVAFALDTPEVNAYSGPTGYIMVTRGLIVRLGDESELAAVIAHEMGHVVEHHGLESVSKTEVWNGAIKALSSSVGRNGAVADLGGNLAGQVFGGAYSQGQENQADSDAVGYLIGAGYDPQGFVRALSKLQSANAPGGLVLSHPGIPQRLQNVQREIDARGARGGQANAERFQAYVRNLAR